MTQTNQSTIEERKDRDARQYRLEASPLATLSRLWTGLSRWVNLAALVEERSAERFLDELFLTLAPQIAGRDRSVERPGLVAGKRFAAAHPLWGTLIGVKRGGSHLFLRYTFETVERP